MAVGTTVAARAEARQDRPDIGLAYTDMLGRYAFILPHPIARGDLSLLRDPQTNSPEDRPITASSQALAMTMRE